MSKFITENDYMNRKVKYQGYVTGIVAFVVTLIGMIKLVSPELAAQFAVDEATLTAIGLGIAGGVAGIMTLVSWIAGYFTSPAPGDGIKPAP